MATNNWQVWHDYNRLVKRGMAAPLLCPDDETQLAMKIGDEDEPLLRCLACDSVFVPGLDLYDKIGAVVNEFYQ